MKKLMIAACAVALAASAQAVTMSWGISYSYDYNGNGDTENGYRGTTQTYLVYLFDNSAYSQADAISAAAEEGWATAYANNVVDGGITSISGDADSPGDTSPVAIDASKFTTYEKSSMNYASAYLAIFDSATLADAKHVYFTEVAESAIPAKADGVFTFEDGDLTGMNGSSNWETLYSVPEPTSGLLLLLGMAGLALKRKRA